TNQMFEITATDLAGHPSVKQLEFRFRPPVNLYTNFTGMVLVKVKNLPETTDRGWAWVGKCEVTQGQFEQVLGTNPSVNRGINYPVENMRLADATDFCAKLTDGDTNKPPGWHYALPSVQQWRFFTADTPTSTIF